MHDVSSLFPLFAFKVFVLGNVLHSPCTRADSACAPLFVHSVTHSIAARELLRLASPAQVRRQARQCALLGSVATLAALSFASLEALLAFVEILEENSLHGMTFYITKTFVNVQRRQRFVCADFVLHEQSVIALILCCRFVYRQADIAFIDVYLLRDVCRLRQRLRVA